jgi:saccharopine dehydrogenase-like NADP-dependent oxidoreductase
VTLADKIGSKAEELIKDHPRGKATGLDVEDRASVHKLISESDLVVSLLPYTYHPGIAEHCVALGKHMVTTSYVSPAMRGLSEKARKRGIILLNETGLDPGIDHMSAMRIIHDIQASGWSIACFYSYAGGLPAPEANDNPFGYKFSWSPRGVVLAGRNSAQYLKDGRVIQVASEDLFIHTWDLEISGLSHFQAYPNRDSLPYIDLYGLKGIQSMYRGTLRNPGWCDTWKLMVDLGLLSLDPLTPVKGETYRELMARHIGCDPSDDVEAAAAGSAGVSRTSEKFKNLSWLGLFSDEPAAEGKTLLDVIAIRLEQKLAYRPNERDMIVLHHDIMAEKPDAGKRRKITSTLIDFGIPGSDSSMARTVSLPAAIAVKLILDGKIRETGVHIPVIPSLYEPILSALESLNIKFREERRDVSE